MNPTKLIGIVLIVVGCLGLAYGGFTYTKETTGVKLGPLELKVQEKETINVPLIVSGGAIAIGVFLLVGVGIRRLMGALSFVKRNYHWFAGISGVIMVTIGLSLVLRSIVTVVWGNDILVYEPKLFPQETVSIAGVPVSQEFIWCFVLSMVLLAVFSVFFKFSKAGVAMRATAFNQQAAQSMGISVKSIFALSWIISAVVSGIGGVLIGNINGINSSLYHFGLKVFPATILGGLDSILGAALGGLIIGLLENLSDGLCKAYLDLSGVKEVAPYVILVVILMIKPYGLFGTKEIERV